MPRLGQGCNNKVLLSIMNRVKAVIGANFGDEGKGLMTDYFAYINPKAIVVRFNGGAQAGHTVVTPDGKRHIFGHIGAGTFVGNTTHLSRFFISNPILFRKEFDTISNICDKPSISVDPNSLVTTPYDMIINQMMESSRGTQRHGSCGCGINETVERSKNPKLKLTVKDLHNPFKLNRIIDTISKKEYIVSRYIAEKIPLGPTSVLVPHAVSNPNTRLNFLFDCNFFLDNIKFCEDKAALNSKDLIFEGAQGLLLDKDNKAMWPHVTSSNTGCKNIAAILSELATTHPVDVVYVSRWYTTRHGAGPLPYEYSSISFPDSTNIPNPHQGTLRFGNVDSYELEHRIQEDSRLLSGIAHYSHLALTCCDQCQCVSKDFHAKFTSYGPSRKDIQCCRNQ